MSDITISGYSDYRPTVWRNAIMTPVKVITEATDMPVTLAEAKNWLKMESINDDDDLIMSLIKSAVTLLQKTWSISFQTRTLSVYLQHNPMFPIRIPYGPISSVSSVEYKSCDCQNLPFSAADPTTYTITDDLLKGQPGYYIVQYIAGFDVTPDVYKTPILQQVAWMYENRGDQIQYQINPAINLEGGALTQNDIM